MLSAGLCYPSTKYFFQMDITRVTLNTISILLVIIPVLIRLKDQSLSNKNERQLLYETIISSIIKGIQHGTFIWNSYANNSQTRSIVPHYVYLFIEKGFITISVCLLFYISTSARDGLISAIPYCKKIKDRKRDKININDVTVFTRPK